MIDITHVAAIGPKPIYTPYGYIITTDGAIYSLLKYAFHGVICALLFPDIAKECGIDTDADTVDEANVFDYQAFEGDNAHRMPVIRVSLGRLTGSINVSKSYAPATPVQIEALRKVFLELGLKMTGRVQGEYNDFSVPNGLKSMTEDESWREEYRRTESRLDERREGRKAWGLDDA